MRIGLALLSALLIVGPISLSALRSYAGLLLPSGIVLALLSANPRFLKGLPAPLRSLGRRLMMMLLILYIATAIFLAVIVARDNYTMSIASIAAISLLTIIGLLLSTKCQSSKTRFISILVSTSTVFVASLARMSIFPFGTFGEDFYYHYGTALPRIMDSGHLSYTNAYTSFPFHYIQSVVPSLVAGIDVTETYWIVGCACIASLVPLTYLLVKRTLGNAEAAVVGAALIPCIDLLAGSAFRPNQLSFYSPMLAILLASAIFYSRSLSIRWLSVFIIVAAVGIGTHQYSSAITLAILGALAIGKRLWTSHDVSHRSSIHRQQAILVMFGVFVFGHWVIAGNHQGISTIVMIAKDFRLSYGMIDGAGSVNTTVLLASTLGSGILLAFSLIGLLRMNDRKWMRHSSVGIEARAIRQIVLPTVAVLGFLLCIGLLAGIEELLPHRIFFFITIVIVPIIGSIGVLFTLGNHRSIPRIAVVAALIMMCAMGQSGYFANQEVSPLTSSIQHTKTYQTMQDVAAGEWISEKAENTSTICVGQGFLNMDMRVFSFRPSLLDFETSAFRFVSLYLDSEGNVISESLAQSNFVIITMNDLNIGLRNGSTSSSFGSVSYVPISMSSLANLRTEFNVVCDSGGITILERENE